MKERLMDAAMDLMWQNGYAAASVDAICEQAGAKKGSFYYFFKSKSELTAADPLVHVAYPMSAKYFLRKRGLPVRTISRTHPLELTIDQKKTLDQLHERFLGWCERLGIRPVVPDAAVNLSTAYPDPPI